MNQPSNLYIYDNWITDIVVYDTSQLGTNCDLSNNPLLGNLDIVNLTSHCATTGLYNASSLPVTVTVLSTSHAKTSSVVSKSSTVALASKTKTTTHTIITTTGISH